MPRKAIRRSVALPPRTAQRVNALARSRRTSANRILVDLIESGLATKEEERQHFLSLTEELASTKGPRARQQLKQELARLTFGE